MARKYYAGVKIELDNGKQFWMTLDPSDPDQTIQNFINLLKPLLDDWADDNEQDVSTQ